MKYSEMLKIIENLEFDKKYVVVKDKGTELFIIRPYEPSKNLKNKYDKKRNFQIWITEGERTFKPNHLRVFIDLNLRARSRPDLKKSLLKTFDNIFYGMDPDIAIATLKNEKFEHYLNSLTIIAHMAQLFIIEQEFNYTKESKYEPKTLFLQGWIRQFIDIPLEIDNMSMRVSKGNSPIAKYTTRENKLSKRKYDPNLKELWYLQ